MTREFPKNPGPHRVALPTVGRIVLFYSGDGRQASPAMVSSVIEGSHTITTAHVFEHDGIRIVSDLRHRDDAETAYSPFWDWMDYQKGQAAKTEELERQLARAQGGPVNSQDRASREHDAAGEK